MSKKLELKKEQKMPDSISWKNWIGRNLTLSESDSDLSPPTGQTVVRQSRPSAHRHHSGGEGPAFEGRRPTAESLRENLLPP